MRGFGFFTELIFYYDFERFRFYCSSVSQFQAVFKFELVFLSIYQCYEC